MTIRVLIADDHSVVRQGLRAFLEGDRGLEIVGEARNGAEAVSQAHRLRPDVILMDLLMPEMDGLAATQAIRHELPDTEVLALTSVLEDAAVVGAVRAGARRCVGIRLRARFLLARRVMLRQPYPSDLSDAEFACLAAYLPAAKARGRPWRHPRREIVDAIFYVVRTGCQWRSLPHEYPPWSTVHYWFRLWRLDGTWERLNGALRERVRVAVGRNPQPSAAILDSQSVKTTSVGGVRGYDGAKKLSGRKRHLLVETQGLVLRAKVHTAELQDRAAVPLVLAGVQEQFPRVEHLWVDQGYTGSGKAWIEEQLGWTVEVVRHPPTPRGQWVPHGDLSNWRTIWFTWDRLPPVPKVFRGVLPRRWVVERTFSWFGQSRRLSKEYERLCVTSEAVIYAAMSRLMLRRLACS